MRYSGFNVLICLFVKTTFRSDVGLTTVSYKAVCVLSSSVFYGGAVKLSTQLHFVQKLRISPFMYVWLYKEDFTCALLC